MKSDLSVAQMVPCTGAEGPGRRFALWFQGCPLRCPGCCNPEMLPFDQVDAIRFEDVLTQLKESKDRSGIEGITLLGGEPFAHAQGAAALARSARGMGLSVMVFTGYTLAELSVMVQPAVADLLGQIDLLVDGRYMQEHPEPRRRWIGSANQQMHFLTNRYQPDDPCFLHSNTLEIRLEGVNLMVNGFPARSVSSFWRRPVRP